MIDDRGWKIENRGLKVEDRVIMREAILDS